VTGEGWEREACDLVWRPFTLVGATTRAGLLKAPFRDRFGIHERLSFYDRDLLIEILKRSANLLVSNCKRMAPDKWHVVAVENTSYCQSVIKARARLR